MLPSGSRELHIDEERERESLELFNEIVRENWVENKLLWLWLRKEDQDSLNPNLYFYNKWFRLCHVIIPLTKSLKYWFLLFIT